MTSSCSTQFRQFGKRSAFEGIVSTVRCSHDILVLKATLGEPGAGRVLVVDGGGSVERALMGDTMGAIAVASGWEGVIINGAVRDSDALSGLDLGIKALGTNSRRGEREGLGDRDVKISFGGCTFSPGERLVSDNDGILVFPAK
ncbi:MAG: ribonuclease E activity regulator RraA [Ruaniaceae bacterium]|nr:ribonuclease E activity regulator RraA [Ruaniaceae bacterium]